MLSRFEIEGAPLGENSVESEEDEEEVWLFWKDSNKEIRSKSIRELAQDAKEGQKEDQEVISYYRSVLDFNFHVIVSNGGDKASSVSNLRLSRSGVSICC